ncbi:hypothetical protein J3459_015031 [Metarhizium acridum]|nr:hypothetical protein J3459_015031 [Metarhizium acridum]
MGHAERHEPSPTSPALDRRSIGSNSGSSENGVCSQCSCKSHTSQSYRTSQHSSPRPLSRTHDGIDELVDRGVYTPPRRTSPSAASGMAFSNPRGSISPLRRDLSQMHTMLPEGIDAVTSRAARHDLARRLSHLARRLTYDGSDDVDENMVGSQLEQLEKVVGGARSAEPKRLQYQASFDSPGRSDVGSVLGSPVLLLFSDRAFLTCPHRCIESARPTRNPRMRLRQRRA